LIGKRRGIEYDGHDRVDFDSLLRNADIISIHTPLSINTSNLFTINEFRKMKPSSVLINVARGGIVNENDLYQALKEKVIRAAAIDVSEEEPMKTSNMLYGLKNILISPHIAWTSYQSRIKLIEGIEHNIEKFLQGRGGEINLAI
jgi:phosphoglycerate dehydrogenase-like enzyme